MGFLTQASSFLWHLSGFPLSSKTMQTNGRDFWRTCLLTACLITLQADLRAGEYVTFTGPGINTAWSAGGNGLNYQDLPPPIGHYDGPLDFSALKQAATNGFPAAQAWLAKYYFDGHPDLPQNRVEAYKWAMIARARNYKPIEPFIAEFDLFLKPEEIKEGKARAEAFLAKEKKEK